MTWEEYRDEEEIEFMRFAVLVQDDANDKRIAERILRRLEKARDELKDKRPTPEWISVKDRMPEEDAKILYVVWNRGEMAYAIQGMRRWDGNDWWWCNEAGDYDDTGNAPGFSAVTHWMPLPEPPPEARPTV